ncbi:MAG: lipoyl(octanoyl) transferase LipB [Bacteroidales bacterium]|nr:lipoyl(octanoyl) transferase LipB [Bacteroidales bacterium]
MNEIIFKDLGLISYADAYHIQNEIFTNSIKRKLKGKSVEGIILFCEHPHVYTIGKSGNRNNLLITEDRLKQINAEFFPVDRGGDITYHGPGQMVMYPIIDLENYHLGVKDYIYLLEYLIIDVLKDYGIKGEISTGNIGVWMDTETIRERKICSVGVKVSRKITMHGIALNVNTDLSYFDSINPCGFTEKSVTSIKKELSEDINMNELKEKIQKELLIRLNQLK